MSVLAIQGRILTAQMREDLAFDAAANAQRVRRELGINPQDPVCVYDAAERLGVEVRFLDANSMEGRNPATMSATYRTTCAVG